MDDLAGHWDSVFTSKAVDQVSWYQAEPTASLRLLRRWASPSGSVIDIGGGASTLVDALLEAGWSDVTVLDVSEAALETVRNRLGDRSNEVHLVGADIRAWEPHRTYRAWHDRAVFHFLTDAADRDRYVSLASEALTPGGILVLATFAADGPSECSGLATSRYDTDGLVRTFGPAFVLEHAEREEHHTPFATIQPFAWVVLRRL